MIQKTDILPILYECVEEWNAQAPPEKRIAKSPQTPLLGAGSPLDSLGLVHLLIGAEQRVGDAFGVSLTLADDKAISQTKSPFRTLETLSDYIVTLLGEHVSAGESQ